MSARVLAHAAGAWSFEPLELVPVLVVGTAYGLRLRTLAARGRAPDGLRLAAFAGALLVIVAALCTPLDSIGEEQLFSAHMAQHLALGDVAAALLVLGLTGPLLRPLLGLRVVRPLAVLLHPPVALGLWTANLTLWHLPAPYEAALHHDAVHALQHACFLAAGVVLWGAVLELLPGPAWFTAGSKLVYLGAAQVAQVVLASVFVWSGRVFYETYASGAPEAGVSARTDQSLGGAVMLAEATVVMAIAVSWAFLALLRESERRQILLEHGASERSASRAARYRR